ncbi:MAG: hypothetical protein C3F06_02110 [Candidatus Methanoperedenaceae archaeon]|nr:MAG: hypothetical protein C3F06_02110 [Candidatus Methanoperedenaceae archaeon]
MFNRRGLILSIFLITCLIFSAQAAKVYGSIYDFSDFEKPLKNVIVEVEENSTRAQYKVSVDGTYFFNVSPGRYVIKAKLYNETNILEFTGEEKINISKPDESRNLDLILFPPIDSELEYLGDINLTGEIETDETDYTNYIILAALIIISIIIFYILKKKKKVIPETGVLPEEKTVSGGELPDDLKELYDIILKKGGRTTQKDLRKEVLYGEAKVSLMIADLEDRGLIKKIKKGRSNIIIAENKK